MAGPKNQELGIRSPLRLRGGIDFPNWEGICRQNDPGAIRNTQLYNAINVRLNGNEIQCRGGEDPLHTTPLIGRVYGFIEASANSAILLANDSDTGTSVSKLSRYYSGATPVFNTVFPAAKTLNPTSSLVDASVARRSLVRYGDGIYQFGDRTSSDTTQTLFRIVLPPFDTPVEGTDSFANQSKLVPVASIPEFASAVQRTVRFSDTAIGPVLYIGSMTTGNVYTWDGTSVVTEDSNMAGSRHIMANYHEDVYAIVGDHMRARNGGLWNTDISLTTSGFTPMAAFEYLDKLFIVGRTAGTPDTGTVLSWNGTSITDHSATIATLVGNPDYTPVDVNVFDGLLYIHMLVVASAFALVTYNNSSFALGPVDTNIAAVGCIEPNGDRLWFTYTISVPEGTDVPWLAYTEGSTTFTQACETPDSIVTDMKAF